MIAIIFWSFILGIIFISFIYPILDALCALIISFIEVLKGKATVKITELNTKIKDISKVTTSSAHAIGFQVYSDEECEEE